MTSKFAALGSWEPMALRPTDLVFLRVRHGEPRAIRKLDVATVPELVGRDVLLHAIHEMGVLGSFEALSQGSVMPQLPRAWRWTRKVGGKTVSLGLTPGKAEKMKHAIANHRALDNIIKELREITQKLILEAPETLPASNAKIVQKAR